MKRTSEFTAVDGTRFETAAGCREHEARPGLLSTLSGRSPAHITAALDRVDEVLANAIERAGNIVARKRRAYGRQRRQGARGASQDGD